MERDKNMTKLEKVLNEISSEQRELLGKYLKDAPQELMDSFRVIELPPNATFIEEGTKAESIYILLKGKVKAVDYRVFETVYNHFEFYPIEVFGAMEIIGGFDCYATTLVTAEESVLLKTSRSLYENFLKDNFEVFKMQVAVIEKYLLRQARKERLNVLLSGNDRIALLLTQMYIRSVGDTKGELLVARKELVDVTGLSERTVTRILKSFESRELISRRGWNILISYEQYQNLKKVLEKIDVIE